jgi:hypothetical protein
MDKRPSTNFRLKKLELFRRKIGDLLLSRHLITAKTVGRSG